MSDNPALETADKFYNNTAESNLDETAEATDVTEQEIQEPEQEVETLEKPEEAEAEAEELESEDDEETTQYIELDGEEISLDEVRKWKNGHLMQSDYTKKTTEHAEFANKERAEIANDREQLTISQTKVSEMQDMLSVLVAEDEAIDWTELKEDDPDRYIELKEKADNRKNALDKVKAERETPADDPAVLQDEVAKLHAANPDWFDKEGKPTETYTTDTQLISEWATKAGMTQEKFSKATDHIFMVAFLKAAKYDKLQEKGQEIKKKRDAVPVVTKPKATKVTTEPKSAAEIFYGGKKTG